MIKAIFLLLAIFVAMSFLINFIYTKKQSYIKYSLLVLVVLVGIYNILKQNSEDNIHTIVVAFNNNKKIICNDISITKNNFNLVTGTNVFVGKMKSSYNSYVIPVETCKVGD